MDDSATICAAPAAQRCSRWKRVLRRVVVLVAVLIACIGWLVKDHIRTLASLRPVPGTKAYVMDYYVDYNIDEVRAHGIDVAQVEDSVMGVLLPKWTLPIATRLKSMFLPQAIRTVEPGDHCSTVTLRAKDGDVFFGRNLDYLHDAFLILKVHKPGGGSSVAVLDLHYLNLDRDDLAQLSLFRRIPLLFAPYYLQDGMNEHGVAVADMSLHGSRAPHNSGKPNVIHSLAMRLILDYAKTTDEAIELLQHYNIHFVAEKVHLMIADRSGKSAIIEFLNGEVKTTTTKENWQVCTNHEICGKDEAANDACCNRYQTASDQLAEIGARPSASDVMKIMESVEQDTTMWSSVYNLSSQEFDVAYRKNFADVYHDRLD